MATTNFTAGDHSANLAARFYGLQAWFFAFPDLVPDPSDSLAVWAKQEADKLRLATISSR